MTLAVNIHPAENFTLSCLSHSYGCNAHNFVSNGAVLTELFTNYYASRADPASIKTNHFGKKKCGAFHQRCIRSVERVCSLYPSCMDRNAAINDFLNFSNYSSLRNLGRGPKFLKIRRIWLEYDVL